MVIWNGNTLGFKALQREDFKASYLPKTDISLLSH
jgi:hypothetical protein